MEETTINENMLTIKTAIVAACTALGAFRVRENAVAQLEKARAAGFDDAFIVTKER